MAKRKEHPPMGERPIVVNAVPESNPPNESEDALANNQIEWCADSECTIPVQHVAHEPIIADEEINGSELIKEMLVEDRGPTGMGKTAEFTPRAKPSRLSLDKTY